MNIAYFLLPKGRVAYLRDDFTFRQGLEKMRHYGYTAIAVITRGGQYAGTVREGDFLWPLLGGTPGSPDTETPLRFRSARELERFHIRDILRPELYPPVRITVPMEELFRYAHQEFVPVTDDMDRFIGIVTQQDVLRCLVPEQNQPDLPFPLLPGEAKLRFYA